MGKTKGRSFSPGKGFITIDAAAQRLGRSKRSLYVYLKDGFLSRHVHAGRVWVKLEEVEQLALELESDMPALTRKNFFALSAQVRQLQEAMALVKRILDVRDDPLHPEPSDAAALWQAASRSLSNTKGWRLEEAELWASQLERFDETTLDILSKVVPHPKPWAVFFELALALRRQALALRSTEGWLPVAQRLDEARKRMRGCILMHIEMGRGSVPPGLLTALDDPKDDLLRRLGAVPQGKSP